MRVRITFVVVFMTIALMSWASADEIAFGPPANLGPNINMGPPINSIGSDGAPCISADGLSLYFGSDRYGVRGLYSDIWMVTRTSVDESWGAAMRLGPAVNSTSYDSWPNISADGLSLYFCSSRSGGSGSYDIWMSTRESVEDLWGNAVNIGSPVNRSSADESPHISPDGLTLYFSSNRSGGSGNYDLWVTTRPTTSDPWGDPVNLGSPTNGSNQESGPSVSSDGLSLYFHTQRSGQPFGYNMDLWVVTRSSVDSNWGTPVNLGATINSADDEACPYISADGLSLYFISTRIGTGYWDIYVATRESTTESFGPPASVTPCEYGPSVSSDGLSVFLCSDRAGGSGGFDLYTAERTSINDPWGSATNLGPTVNTSGVELSPSISGDGLSLYFCSNRPGGLGSYDIWVTTRNTLDDDWGTPTNLGSSVNSSYGDAFPDVSEDGLTLYFAEYDSIRPAGLGAGDIWVSTRTSTSESWGPAVNLGSGINSLSIEEAPSISSDGLALYFTSNRDGGYGSNDIWVARRASTSEPFGRPVNLGPNVNSLFSESGADILPDGITVYISSDRQGGLGGWDLWQVKPQTSDMDLNQDGSVDFRDISCVAEKWLWQATWR